MANPRKHHFLPVFYLKGFTESNSEDGPLHVLDLKTRRWFSGTPRSQGFEKDLYKADLDDADDPYFVERAFGELETGFSEVVTQISRTCRVPRKFRAWNLLLNFVALQAARVPGIREIVNNLMTKSIIAHLKQLADDPAQLSRLKADAEGKGEEFFSNADELREYIDLLETGRLRLSLDQNHQLHGMIQGVDPMLKALARRQILLATARNGAPDFICCDMPVAKILRPAFRLNFTPAVALKHLEFLFPLTRRHALVFSPTFRHDKAIEWDRDMVAVFNCRIAAHARRYVYSAHAQFSYTGQDGVPRESVDLETLLHEWETVNSPRPEINTDDYSNGDVA